MKPATQSRLSLEPMQPAGGYSTRRWIDQGFIQRLLGLGLAASAGWVAAASVEGTVEGQDGAGLHKVAICLKSAGMVDDCAALRWTDRQGFYRFTGLKPDLSYSVEVFADTSATTRKFENYRTYVWAPRLRAAAISGKSERLVLPPFVGKFNFSNFQRVITLVGADFPELSGIDLAAEYVALKVSLPAAREGEPPETVFLGQVSDPGQLAISVSPPVAARAINYEIYSASLSLSGSIEVAGN